MHLADTLDWMLVLKLEVALYPFPCLLVRLGLMFNGAGMSEHPQHGAEEESEV